MGCFSSYREVLHRPLENIDAVRADRPARGPVVLTPEETKQVLLAMSGTPALVAKLLYGIEKDPWRGHRAYRVRGF